jgi:Protein of unknown function (DUF551)
VKWISVKDKLPPDNLVVFVCGFKPHHWFNMGAYKKNRFIDTYDGETLENVSYWMELPEFPKEYYNEVDKIGFYWLSEYNLFTEPNEITWSKNVSPNEIFLKDFV